jgi:hypothetical protein
VLVGETVMLEPVPTNVPPQVPRYHFQTAPVPNEPPFTVSVTEAPVVILNPGFAVINVAATLGVLMVSVSVTVLSHPAAFNVTNVYTPELL